LERVEERLPPGDTVLAGLWTGALLGRAAPFLDDDAAVLRAVSEPVVSQVGRLTRSDSLAPTSVSSWVIGTENFSPDYASNQEQDIPKSTDRPTNSGNDPFTPPWEIGLFNLLPGETNKSSAPARLGDAEGLTGASARSSEASAFSGGGSPSDERTGHSAEHFAAGHYAASPPGTLEVRSGGHDLSMLDGAAQSNPSFSPSDVSSPLSTPQRSQITPTTPANVSSDQTGPNGPSSIWTSGNNGVIGVYPACAVLQASSMAVPSTNSTGATSTTPLLNGVTYTLIASGEFRVSTSPLVRGDAQYQNMINPSSMAADGVTPVGLTVVGARLLSSNWGAYHPHHVYRMQVVGQGQPIRVYYSDEASAYAQHQGSLSVQILQAAPNGSATCPSVTPPDCGDDESLIEENNGADGGDDTCDAYSEQPFRYFDGNLRQRQRDLLLSAAPDPQRCTHWFPEGGGCADPIPTITPKLDQNRAYTNNPGTTPNTYNGPGTVLLQQPFLQEPDGTDNTVVVVSTETSARFFDLSGGTYHGRFWVKDTLVHTGSEFVLADTTGKIFHFNDFTSAVTNQRGQLNSMIDQAGNTMTVSRFGSSDPNAGKVQEQQWTIGANGAVDSFLYTYIPSTQTNGGLVQNVLRRRKPSSNGAWTTIRQVAYTYYDGSTTFGNLGNLQTATTEDAAGNPIDAEYYRYYKPGDPLGFTNGLKYVVNPQSYARAQTGLAGQPAPNNNPLTADDAHIAPYADHYFEYNAAQMVSKEVAQGAGRSTSSTPGLGTFTYQYFTSTATPTDLANNAAFKTIETLPDNNTNTVYANYNGQVMLKVFQSGNQQWITYFQHDASGHRTMKAYPSAVSGFDEEKPDLLDKTNPDGTVTPMGYLNDHSGRIELADYFSGTTTAGEGVAGNVNGYLMDVKIEQGKADPAPALLASVQYFAHTADPANGGATVYPVAKTIAYRNGTNNCTDASNCEETDFSYSWLSINNQTTTRIQSRTVQQPVALATQNGPGAADVETEVYDNWGRVIWSRNSINPTGGVADGYIFYTEYDPQSGGVVKTIEDVDMTKTTDFQNAPPGWSSPSGTRLHLITKFEVDALGRQTKRIDPAGTVSYTVYFDANHESRTYPGWYVVNNVAYTTGPIVVSREDRTHSAGSVYMETATASTAPQSSPDPGNPITAFPPAARPS
jgi:hypothetical protein